MSKPPSDNGRTPDQLAPHSVEAEEAVLGSIILDQRAIDDVRGFLAPGHFFIVRNEWVYAAACALYDRRENIDYLTVVAELERAGRLEGVGGASYVTHLINNTPSSIYAEAYARIVQRAAIRRGLLRAASLIAQTAHDETTDIDGVVDASEEALFEVTAPLADDDMVALGDLLSADMDRVEAARAAGKPAMGVLTGFTDIDRLLHGFKSTDLVIIAGRPGMGKSALMITAALHAAHAGQPVAFFTLEMSKEQVVQRLVSQESGISLGNILDGNLSDQEWKLYVDTVARINRLPLYIDDNASLTPMKLRTKARRAVRRRGVKMIMVDYLQLMVTAGKSENRAQEVSQITRGLKQLAKEIGVPVVSAAQLNRDVEKRQDKRPQLSDLKESGSIEQDSDVVLFLYREDYYDENSTRANQADVIVAKHRNGATGVATLFFRKELTAFSNLTRTGVDLAGF